MNPPKASIKEEQICRVCKVSKPLSEFYLATQTKVRKMLNCKECKKIKSRENYEKSRDKVLARTIAYQKTPVGRIVQNEISKRANRREPEKALARYKLRYAVSRGTISKQPCQECGDTKVEAHHYKGYEEENWYEVKWLCRFHHRAEHGFLTQTYIRIKEMELSNG